MNLRDQLLAKQERKHQVVVVDGITLRLRELREAERTEFDVWLRDSKGQTRPSRLRDSRLKLITLCLVDEDGNCVLHDDDIVSMRDWAARRVAKLAEVCMTLCGLGDDDVEGEVKNSDAAQG